MVDKAFEEDFEALSPAASRRKTSLGRVRRAMRKWCSSPPSPRQTRRRLPANPPEFLLADDTEEEEDAKALVDSDDSGADLPDNEDGLLHY